MKKKVIFPVFFALLLVGCGFVSSSEDQPETIKEDVSSGPVIEMITPDEADKSSPNIDIPDDDLKQEAAVQDVNKTEPDEEVPNDFISRHGYLESRETESSELNNTMWCSFDSYNKNSRECGDYRSETPGEFKNASMKLGEMGEGVLYLDDEEIGFTYVLAEYPTKAEGKTRTGEDISMEFYTFNFDGSDIETIQMEVGEWSIDFWPLG